MVNVDGDAYQIICWQCLRLSLGLYVIFTEENSCGSCTNLGRSDRFQAVNTPGSDRMFRNNQNSPNLSQGFPERASIGNVSETKEPGSALFKCSVGLQNW